MHSPAPPSTPKPSQAAAQSPKGPTGPDHNVKSKPTLISDAFGQVAPNTALIKRACWMSCCSSIGLVVMLLLILFAFGESIAFFESDREIEENREFQTLLASIRPKVTEEEFNLIVRFSNRDEIRGIEGFSIFIEDEDDWSSGTVETFFGAASYTFDLATTIGYGSFTAQTMEGRLLSIFCIVLVFPFAVVTYTRFVDLVFNLVSHFLIRTNSKYKAIISRYDANNNGKLDVKELYLVFQDLKLQVTQEQTEIILHQYDVSHDEHLNEAEFRQLCIDLDIGIGLLGRSYFQFEFAIVAFVLYTALFTLVTFFLLELSAFDSFYFVVITVSTVGLGDVVPPQEKRALFSLLAFFGVGFMAMLFKAIIDKMYDGTDLKKRYFKRAMAPVFDKSRHRIKSVVYEDEAKDEIKNNDNSEGSVSEEPNI